MIATCTSPRDCSRSLLQPKSQPICWLALSVCGAYYWLGDPILGGVLRPVEIQGVSPPAAIGRIVRTLWNSDREHRIDLANLTRPASFVVFLVAVTLPQWSAFSAILQDTVLLSWTELVLAAPDGSARIGEPLGGGNVIALPGRDRHGWILRISRVPVELVGVVEMRADLLLDLDAAVHDVS